jgi:hypothetical protein
MMQLSVLRKESLLMIFKSAFVILFATSSLAAAEGEVVSYASRIPDLSGTETSGALLSPLGRPLLLRSDALSSANYEKLYTLAHLRYDPRTGIPYDWRGFPKMKSAFDVQLKPLQFRSPLYGKLCNEQLLAEIRRNPSLHRQFTARDIELLENGRNPQGKHWHHDPRRKGQMQLVDSTEHSVDHVGGDKVWGRINEKAFAKATALRWGSVAVFDIAISSVGLAYAGEFDLDHFAQLTTRSVAGGAAAFGTEYFLVKLMPQTVGMPPSWFVGIRMLYGSPAAWAATLAYAATRALVDYCWDSHRLHQLQIQEQVCRVAETRARWQQINAKVQANTDTLIGLLGD